MSNLATAQQKAPAPGDKGKKDNGDDTKPSPKRKVTNPPPEESQEDASESDSDGDEAFIRTADGTVVTGLNHGISIHLWSKRLVALDNSHVWIKE